MSPTESAEGSSSRSPACPSIAAISSASPNATCRTPGCSIPRWNWTSSSDTSAFTNVISEPALATRGSSAWPDFVSRRQRAPRPPLSQMQRTITGAGSVSPSSWTGSFQTKPRWRSASPSQAVSGIPVPKVRIAEHRRSNCNHPRPDRADTRRSVPGPCETRHPVRGAGTFVPSPRRLARHAPRRRTRHRRRARRPRGGCDGRVSEGRAMLDHPGAARSFGPDAGSAPARLRGDAGDRDVDRHDRAAQRRPRPVRDPAHARRDGAAGPDPSRPRHRVRRPARQRRSRARSSARTSRRRPRWRRAPPSSATSGRS